MTRVLFVGQAPETIDFSDPSVPPGLDARKINEGIRLAEASMTERGWKGDLCMITPDDSGIATLAAQLAKVSYECVVIGAGVRVPSQSLLLFERIVNAVHQGAPGASIAFNTRPEGTADAAARWIRPD